jgi:hypothetical protein
MQKSVLGRALEYGELVLQKAISQMEKGVSQADFAYAWVLAGEPNRGIEVLALLFSITRAGGLKYLHISFGIGLILGYRMVGEYDKAIQTAEECL